MAIIEANVEIREPVEKVFAYVADAKNWPRWESAMLEAEQTSPGQMGVGTTFRGANRAMGRRVEWTSKVTEYEINRKWGEAITFGSTMIEEHLTFEPSEGGTKFTIFYDVKVGGFLKLFTVLMVNTMRKQTKVNLVNLKTILEA
jgi:uncharacterized protein YndB with AHSA1/START domain